MIDRERMALGATARTPGCCHLKTVAVAAMLAAAMLNAVAANAGWRDLFPFGGDEPTADETQMENDLLLDDPTIDAVVGEDENGWMVTSPLGNLSWPEIKMPKFEFNPPWRSGENSEGGWFATPIARARTSAHNAMKRTRSAWNSTVDRMKFALPGGAGGGVDSEPQVAEAKQPGFWDRFLGPKEPVAETDDVVEMMAQEHAAMQR
jgi:hypothetical protein